MLLWSASLSLGVVVRLGRTTRPRPQQPTAKKQISAPPCCRASWAFTSFNMDRHEAGAPRASPPRPDELELSALDSLTARCAPLTRRPLVRMTTQEERTTSRGTLAQTGSALQQQQEKTHSKHAQRPVLGHRNNSKHAAREAHDQCRVSRCEPRKNTGQSWPARAAPRQRRAPRTILLAFGECEQTDSTADSTNP